jgi:sodium transport system permease protein
VAAFARSSKEGQYYLMPLLLVTLPLIMLPMLPATRLELGTSLIPVTGVMLLLRSLIEGQYVEALRFVVPVVGVTLLCCLLAIRWAVHQFNDESVLFRESERWGLGLWLRQLVRDRGDTPTVHEAILCGFLLLLIRFFAGFAAKSPETWASFVFLNLIGQVALIATPALLMTIILTRSPQKTLLLSARRPLALPAALLLAVALHPLVMLLGSGIEQLYPKSEATSQSLASLMAIVQQAPLWQVLLLMAVLPAICEELAFRGFILSGLRHTGHKWAAIVVSAVFFGVTHVILQQALVTCVVGVVIGYIVIQSGSLLTGMVFHMTHNALFLTAGRFLPERIGEQSPLRWLAYTTGQGDFVYHWPWVVVCGAIAAGLLWWFRRIPYQPYAEEALQTALDHQPARATTR